MSERHRSALHPVKADFFGPIKDGAMIVGALTALRSVLYVTIALARGRPADLIAVPKFVALGAAAGALAGLAYSSIGRPLRRVPKVGPYLAGTATAPHTLRSSFSS